MHKNVIIQRCIRMDCLINYYFLLILLIFLFMKYIFIVSFSSSCAVLKKKYLF